MTRIFLPIFISTLFILICFDAFPQTTNLVFTLENQSSSDLANSGFDPEDYDVNNTGLNANLAIDNQFYSFRSGLFFVSETSNPIQNLSASLGANNVIVRYRIQIYNGLNNQLVYQSCNLPDCPTVDGNGVNKTVNENITFPNSGWYFIRFSFTITATQGGSPNRNITVKGIQIQNLPPGSSTSFAARVLRIVTSPTIIPDPNSNTKFRVNWTTTFTKVGKIDNKVNRVVLELPHPIPPSTIREPISSTSCTTTLDIVDGSGSKSQVTINTITPNETTIVNSYDYEFTENGTYDLLSFFRKSSSILTEVTCSQNQSNSDDLIGFATLNTTPIETQFDGEDGEIGVFGALPVELFDFEGSESNEKVILRWKTAFELDNYGFEIERSTNGLHFTKIGKVKGRGDFSGVSSYQYEDFSPVFGQSNYYRLKQMDFSGNESFSEIIRVRLDHISLNSAVVFKNPISSGEPLQITTNFPNHHQIQIVDLRGNSLYSADLSSGSNTLSISETKLKRGIYLIGIKSKEFHKSFRLIIE
jgi:hypothetical protein